MTTTVTCPHCGSSSLLHLHRTLVARQVRRWTVDNNGDVAPAAFSDYPRVLDVDSMDNVDFPYQCGNCLRECTASDLVVTRSDGQNPPHAAGRNGVSAMTTLNLHHEAGRTHQQAVNYWTAVATMLVVAACAARIVLVL